MLRLPFIEKIRQNKAKAKTFREAREKKEAKLQIALEKEQAACQPHDFGDVQQYMVVSAVRHFVVCRKCALRRDI